MHRYLTALPILLLQATGPVQGQPTHQGLNNLWMGGYSTHGDPPWGAVDLDYFNGTQVITTPYREIYFYRTSANITDTLGQLLFSTNGAYVANATGNTMLNGSGLSPSWYTSDHPDGLLITQGCLILPKPDTPGIYYLIHCTVDIWVPATVSYLYLSTIDMSLDGGLGGVVEKNHVLLEDSLNVGGITAVRHANGRDWWVFCHRINTDLYFRFLVTPEGISLDGTQHIGSVRYSDLPQTCFSPDGTRFAYYWGYESDLDVLDFDRCTGLFSNPRHVDIDDANAMAGVAFSPSGRYLYVSSTEDVYQFDAEAADLAGSLVHIAHWDSTYSPFPPLATKFDIAQLAPDGKIYIGTGNSTLHLHVIHDPDQPGLACNMEQHGVELPRLFVNSLPNHPNYHLGALGGTVCDSLGLGLTDPSAALRVTVRPNPSTGAFVLSYPVQAAAGQLEVLDAAGRIVHTAYLAPWSQLHHLELRQPPGLYHCRLRWSGRVLSTRVMIIEP